ncbi:MAG: SDR family NAD(P)-dependent oxidoreductase [Burkholderiales bacterium]|nr:SDR family NAD(P)-dependent oxidoreductase [Burkholderiales bacterium]
MLEWSTQTAFVTGASGGIGRELVAGLLERRVRRVYAADSMLAEALDSRVTAIELDITAHAAVQQAANRYGDTTLLINNAGVNLRAGFIKAPTLEAARREMEVNYFGTLAMCRAFAPVLEANGGGALVNVLSILAKITNPALGSYCATKAALLRLTEGVRAELASQGTHVLAAMPWAVDTAMSGPFAGAKSSPAEVAQGILDAIASGVEEVYFHEMSAEINRRLSTDPKGLERSFSSWLPR